MPAGPELVLTLLLQRVWQRIRKLLGVTLDPSSNSAVQQAVQTALDGLAPLLQQEALRGLTAAVDGLTTPSAQLRTGLDLVDPRAQAWAEQRAAQLVQHVTDEVREQIAQVTHRAVSGDLTWASAARTVRPLIGLTPRWQRAVTTARAAAYENALTSGASPVKAASIAEAHATRYADRLLASRAQTIARTEIMTAQNQGRWRGWVLAQQQGLISPEARKRWLTAPDGTARGGPCPVCRPLNGETRLLSEPFSVGVQIAPAHPRCRCTATLLPNG